VPQCLFTRIKGTSPRPFDHSNEAASARTHCRGEIGSGRARLLLTCRCQRDRPLAGSITSAYAAFHSGDAVAAAQRSRISSSDSQARIR
jgi:hypothetical protein